MAETQINNSSPPRKPVMTVKDLAASLDVNIATALRDLKRKGFAIDKVRTRSGQMTSVIRQGGSRTLLRRVRGGKSRWG